MASSFFFSKRAAWLWGLGLLFYLATALSNIGIVAIDDYACMISKIIPAQSHTVHQVIAERDIRSPFAPLVLLGLTKTALNLGIDSPANQLRFVLVLLGIFSFVTFSFTGSSFFEGEKGKREWLLFLCGFYFLCPLFLTRPLIESLSAPFLLLSCGSASAYWKNERRKDLVLALIYVAIAAMFRFQSGICYLALLMMVLSKKKVGDILFLLLISGLVFLASGGLDYWITGGFHGSLLTYVNYNLHYSSSFGVTPFYTFILLFLGLSLPPTLLASNRNFDWRLEYRSLIPVIFYFAVFLIIHSAVPHKEERFIIPILPLFLILLVPWIHSLAVLNPKGWRIRGFVVINLILLPVASFSIPQNNSIGLVQFLSAQSGIKNLISVEDTLVLYPKEYTNQAPGLIRITLKEASQLTELDCKSVMAVRFDYADQLKNLTKYHVQLKKFQPGPLEQLGVVLNPSKNKRRGAILLYANPNCVSKF
jgi:Alg9-like mannosyltransferase family